MTDWTKIASGVSYVVTTLAPVAAAALGGPAGSGLAEALSIGVKIVQGVIEAEPAAVALYEQIKSGETPTPAQLQQFEADYEAAYLKLKADIAAKLAAMPE